MPSIPEPGPPLPRDHGLGRDLPAFAAVACRAAGWADCKVNPGPSLVYGLADFIVSLTIVAGMFELALDYILFPALAGFMVVGPVLAIGLYEKSRRIADGVPVTLAGMVFVRSRSGGQILFPGVLLSLLMRS